MQENTSTLHPVLISGVFTHGKNSHEGEVVALKRHFVLWCARRGWGLWRFASLIPSGWRLPPIHKVMGDHASRGTTAAGGFCRHVVSPDGHFRDTLLENCRFWATK